ncbi:hypothetical protein N4G70_31185 [Streptomyces sp. ASQP_92]|uniref:hypothetical protein n=1 Tax=Streptomyces sp. ASQP_92 TaxID=2979116 RepID=UPI0021C1A1E4|nr:hypothetical protein [Streptomyces sp. ASQP_92]MCT9093297.1 hypothetical protein [Streptomyces sp. ASQP_92]
MSDDLKKGPEALKTFKKRVEALHTEFDGSHGGHTHLTTRWISRTSFSAGAAAFPEADGLFTQYHRVHERLTSLSQSLSHQIEATGIAALGAERGTDPLARENGTGIAAPRVRPPGGARGRAEGAGRRGSAAGSSPGAS